MTLGRNVLEKLTGRRVGAVSVSAPGDDGSFTVTCLNSKGQERLVALLAEDYDGFMRWFAPAPGTTRPLIQDALPRVSMADRETLMSGMLDDEFKALWLDDEEDDE